MKKWINRNTDKKQDIGGDLTGSNEAGNSYESSGVDKPRKTLLIDKKKPWSLKKKIIVTAASVLGAVVIGVGIFIATRFINPMGGFQTVIEQASREPSAAATQQTEGPNGPEPTPTLDPYGELIAKSDFSILENTVNILLVGIDYAPERDDWRGKKYFHSDVMIVLAINRSTNSVNLISLPRDTYAKIPGVDGIYKLNASIDCGGGWKDDPDAGLKKVCEAASWMIGGIPVDYYYAVDMTSVKGLVDAVGGVQGFDVDLAFKMQGRTYQAGKQDMNGQAVLDYLRVRKDSSIISPSKGETGDLNRINRQKNMLVAIFQKLKDSGILFKIPDIIDAFDGNLKTNVDFSSTAALAAYAYQVDSANIKMHSMDGSSANIFNWNFVLTSESKRAEIIKEVYGFDISKKEERQALETLYGIKVPSYSDYTSKHAYGLWQKMQIDVTDDLARGYLDSVKQKLDADAALPPYPTPAPVTPAPSTEPVEGEEPTATPEPSPSPTPIPSDGFRRFYETGPEWTLYLKAEAEYNQIINWNTGSASRSTNEQFKKAIGLLHDDVQALYAMFQLGEARTAKQWDDKYWHVNYGDHPYKTDINQSYVENEKAVDFN